MILIRPGSACLQCEQQETKGAASAALPMRLAPYRLDNWPGLPSLSFLPCLEPQAFAPAVGSPRACAANRALGRSLADDVEHQPCQLVYGVSLDPVSPSLTSKKTHGRDLSSGS